MQTEGDGQAEGVYDRACSWHLTVTVPWIVTFVPSALDSRQMGTAGLDARGGRLRR
jgi:hypothetical protein